MFEVVSAGAAASSVAVRDFDHNRTTIERPCFKSLLQDSSSQSESEEEEKSGDEEMHSEGSASNAPRHPGPAITFCLPWCVGVAARGVPAIEAESDSECDASSSSSLVTGEES